MPSEWEENERKKDSGAFITIGSFDGIHLGHQAILHKLVKESHESGNKAIVVTFFPHPAKLFRDVKGPYYLTSPEEKDELLTSLGVDTILTLHFDHSLAKKSAASFIRLLHDQLHFSCLLIGYDFRLGSNRDGDFHLLTELGKELGYCVRAIDPFVQTSQTVSSSIIRDLIQTGDIAAANELLGRPYSLEGIVVHGDGRGKHIGLPTANLSVWDEKLLPKGGIYAAFAYLGGQRYLSAINIGSRPTFYKLPAQQTIEAFILDFDKNIYGQKVRLDIIQHIRSEKKFDSADDLMVQINKDIQQTREVLTHVPYQTNLSA